MLDSFLAREFLDRWWGGRIADSIRILRTIKNKGGAVFDIYEDQYDRFMDNYQHILSQEADRMTFTVERCQELPELAEDDSQGGSGWRNDGDAGGNSYGGGGNSYGGGGNSYGGGRGGRGGGGFSGNRGGGGYQDRNDGGGYRGGRGGRGGY